MYFLYFILDKIRSKYTLHTVLTKSFYYKHVLLLLFKISSLNFIFQEFASQFFQSYLQHRIRIYIFDKFYFHKRILRKLEFCLVCPLKAKSDELPKLRPTFNFNEKVLKCHENIFYIFPFWKFWIFFVFRVEIWLQPTLIFFPVRIRSITLWWWVAW